MEAYLVWTIIAIVILLLELTLNTIYLLAVFIGAVTAVCIAFMGGSFNTQLTAAAIVTIIGVIIAFFMRKHSRAKGQNSEEGNLDRDNLVEVKEIDSDGSARVSYRGTYWKAFANDGTLETGMYRIDHVEGTRLIIKKK